MDEVVLLEVLEDGSVVASCDVAEIAFLAVSETAFGGAQVADLPHLGFTEVN